MDVETTDTLYPRLIRALRVRLVAGYRVRYARKRQEATDLYAAYERALQAKDAEETGRLIPLIVAARLAANTARRDGMIVAKLLAK
jgi:hypothetical protein